MGGSGLILRILRVLPLVLLLKALPPNAVRQTYRNIQNGMANDCRLHLKDFAKRLRCDYTLWRTCAVLFSILDGHQVIGKHDGMIQVMQDHNHSNVLFRIQSLQELQYL